MAELELCLEFVNTEGVERNEPPDRLADPEIFLEWAARQGLVDATTAGELRDALEDRRAAARFLGRARELREALYRIFSSVAAKRPPAKPDLALLDRELAGALSGLRLARRENRFVWTLAHPARKPADLLRPIALSAADLLRSEEFGRVKECGGDTCSAMFIDGSRNRSRRWCDMADCGNRAKARRFHRRHASRT